MGAKRMREFIERAGMSCAQQKLIPWGDTRFFMDCISISWKRRERSGGFQSRRAAVKKATSFVYKNNSGYGQETIFYIVTENG